MKLLIISGSYPPDVCGVGDYTERLLCCNFAKNNDWILYSSKKWSLLTVFIHIKLIKTKGYRCINIQYPTQGYGWSIVPHLICVYFSLFSKIQCSVTIHEQSQMSFKARFVQWFMLLFANKVIFTNIFERDYAIKHVPFISKRSIVIKIFSNIRATVELKKIEDREYDLLNFGHIRPNKGLEQFIETIQNLEGNNYRTCIAGQVPEGYEKYFEEIQNKAICAGIEMKLNLSDDEVSGLLNNTKMVFLPFPDGVSERRGSLLASMYNGAVVYTTVGKFTTSKLENAVLNCENHTIPEVLCDFELLVKKQKYALDFILEEMPKSWNDVAQNYICFLDNEQKK